LFQYASGSLGKVLVLVVVVVVVTFPDVDEVLDVLFCCSRVALTVKEAMANFLPLFIGRPKNAVGLDTSICIFPSFDFRSSFTRNP